MLKIRLQRVGRRHEPVFRVVVIDSHKGPKAGNAVEVLGIYDPRFNKSEIKKERVTHWMSHGAQVSPTVHNLFVENKIIEGKKVNVLPKKTALVQDAEEGAEESTPTASSNTEPVADTDATTSVEPEDTSADKTSETDNAPQAAESAEAHTDDANVSEEEHTSTEESASDEEKKPEKEA